MPIEKRWVLKPQGDPQRTAQLAAATGIPKVLANLLVQRGIDTYESVSRFFNPKLSDLHDPFLMKDMDKAVRRIDEAVSRGEKIMVYGDYDVDGTTAVALVYIFLRQQGVKDMLFYIPDRYTEGYGISKLGVDYAKRQGVNLIIALDCGIKAVEKVAYANQLGIDFIICDHHLPGEEIPAAVAVLDPKREDDTYPFDELSGCGVGFKLVQGYCQMKGIPFEHIMPLLDLVVVSTAADIVPLVDENRILAHYGLLKLNENPRKGLQSIIKICGLEGHKITIDDIVFKIGPRINAAGRMAVDREEDMTAPSGGHAAVNLLVERDEDLADAFGKTERAQKSSDAQSRGSTHEDVAHHRGLGSISRSACRVLLLCCILTIGLILAHGRSLRSGRCLTQRRSRTTETHAAAQTTGGFGIVDGRRHHHQTHSQNGKKLFHRFLSLFLFDVRTRKNTCLFSGQRLPIVRMRCQP